MVCRERCARVERDGQVSGIVGGQSVRLREAKFMAEPLGRFELGS